VLTWNKKDIQKTLGGFFVNEVIFTKKAQNPSTMPYSQAIKTGNTVYVASQGPFDPETGYLVGTTLEEQAIRTLNNLQAILEEAGAKLSDVVKVTVFLGNGAGFDSFNDIYKKYFKQPYPARTIAHSDMGFMVQIDAIAVINGCRTNEKAKKKHFRLT
jgi:2-iminobutanoate/2-iminopropanoate deaminase